jgi:hypothetical protein
MSNLELETSLEATYKDKIVTHRVDKGLTGKCLSVAVYKGDIIIRVQRNMGIIKITYNNIEDLKKDLIIHGDSNRTGESDELAVL